MSKDTRYEKHQHVIKTSKILPNNKVLLKGVEFTKEQNDIVSSIALGGIILGAGIMGILWLIFK